MSYALVDVLFTLTAEAFIDCFILAELAVVCQMLKLQLFKALLDLAKRQLDCVELRAIWHVENVLHLKHFQLALDEVSLVCTEVIHHDHYLILLVDSVEVVQERREYILINCFIMELNELKATTFANGCDHCCIAGTHRLAWYVDICSAFAPSMSQVRGLCENHLV